MQIITASNALLALSFSTLAASTSINNLLNRDTSTGNIRTVEPGLRAEVVEGVFANTEAAILDQSYNAPRPFTPGNPDENGVLPVLNVTQAFILPAAIENGLTDNMRKLFKADPMWFRMLARRRAETRERVDDLFDFLNGSSSTSSSTPTPTSLANQGQINSIVSDVQSMLDSITTTRDEARAYATSVQVSLISDALVLNLAVQTPSPVSAGQTATYTYETKTTSYPAIAKARALVTSYLVLVRVSETGSAASSSPTISASSSAGNTSTSTSAAGAGRPERTAGAMLGLAGIAIGLVL